MAKRTKWLLILGLLVVGFLVPFQTANARVVLPLNGDCPGGSPIRTQVDSDLVCLSLDEFCPTNPQWFMDFSSPLKCPDYQNNPAWISYVATSTTAVAGSSTSTTAVAGSITSTTAVPDANSGSTSSPRTKSATTTTTEPPAVEDDGEVEDDFADLSIRKQSDKYEIRVTSSLGETEMIVRAIKRNSRAVTWSFVSSPSGSYRIITSRDLKGFTVSLWIDGDKWDSLTIR